MYHLNKTEMNNLKCKVLIRLLQVVLTFLELRCLYFIQKDCSLE